MLDDLRQQASDSYEEEPVEDAHAIAQERAPKGDNFLGMTAGQRFILAVMMLMMVCVLGVFALIAFDKVYLPFIS